MLIAWYLTAFWFFVEMLTLILAKYHKIPFPKLTQWRNILLFILEVSAIIIAIYPSNRTNSSPYIFIPAIFLLLTGWVTSHQSLLLRFFKGRKRRPRLWLINLLFEGSENPQSIYSHGDWLQIAAIALIWNSPHSLIISCVIYPGLVYIFSSMNTRNYNKPVTDKSELIKNEVWINFLKIIIRNIVRSVVVALFLLTPLAIMGREWTIFFGKPQDAINLITTLAQVETTVIALVITFLFVLVEFTNSAYSPRLVKSFTRTHLKND